MSLYGARYVDHIPKGHGANRSALDGAIGRHCGKAPLAVAMSSVYPKQRPKIAHDAQETMIPTMTTAIRRKIRNQRQPL